MKRENEYVHIANLITNLISTKNNLQVFSFTVIVTLIGIVCEFNGRINIFHGAFRIILLAFPLLLVVAFSSVISYYKLIIRLMRQEKNHSCKYIFQRQQSTMLPPAII